MWNFLSLWIIAALIIWGAVASGVDEAKIDKYRKHPQVEDTIVFSGKMQTYPYEYFKIIAINKDQFIVMVSKHGYKRLSKAESAAKIGKQEKFGANVYTLPKKKLDTFTIKKWIRKTSAKK